MHGYHNMPVLLDQFNSSGNNIIITNTPIDAILPDHAFSIKATTNGRELVGKAKESMEKLMRIHTPHDTNQTGVHHFLKINFCNLSTFEQ